MSGAGHPDAWDGKDMPLSTHDALRLFHTWATDPLAMVVDTVATGEQGSVFEFSAVPLASFREGRLAVPILAFLCSVQDEEVWDPEVRSDQASRLGLIERTEWSIEAYAEPLLSVLNRGHAVSYYAACTAKELVRTLDEALCVSTFPAFGCVLSAYTVIAGEPLSLEEACDHEGVQTGDLEGHTAFGNAAATARLVQAVSRRCAS